MPRTTIPAASIVTPVGPYPTLQPAADSLTPTWQAADVANGNQFALGTGKYDIHARNVHASIDYTVTLTSSADERKRTGDITTYNVDFGKQMIFRVDQQAGWVQSDGMFYLSGSNAAVEFLIVRLP